MEGNSTLAPDPAHIRDRAYGSMFFIVFGALWLQMGMAGSRLSTRVTGGLLSLVLLLIAVDLVRRTRHAPDPPPTADSIRATRMFRAVNIIQWVSVATAVLILAVLHMPQYITAAIGVIVGLHLLPLAQTFHHTAHYCTGTALIAWSLGSLLLTPAAQVSTVSALGVATILLLSAAYTLAKSAITFKAADLQG